MLLMTVTMKQVSVTSLLLILGIVCSASGTLDDSQYTTAIIFIIIVIIVIINALKLAEIPKVHFGR